MRITLFLALILLISSTKLKAEESSTTNSIFGGTLSVAVYLTNLILNSVSEEVRTCIYKAMNQTNQGDVNLVLANCAVKLQGAQLSPEKIALNSTPVSQQVCTNTSSKYQSDASWNTSSNWACLKFNMDNPQYYVYQYSGSSAQSPTFSASAWGDLNGDAVQSTFTLQGAVTSGQARTAPAMAETDPEE